VCAASPKTSVPLAKYWNFMRAFITALLLMTLTASSVAATVSIDAANPGAISGSGRDLSFDLSAVSGEIVSAELQLSINYSKASELRIGFVDGAGLTLPIAGFQSLSGNASLSGVYRFNDRAVATWAQAQAHAAGGPLSTAFPTRAFQFGPLGQCLNLIGRFLEFDSNRALPLTLQIQRQASVTPGSGSITAARLLIETNQRDMIQGTGFEEPSTPITLCKRPSADLLRNAQTETLESPIAIIDFGSTTRKWYVRQRNPLTEFDPIDYSQTGTAIYAGRFGGRSRMNFGFWDPVTGAVNFTTGSGNRAIELEGNWTTTDHVPIPGDYDGDGITDVAMAFIPSDRWFARIRYSSTGMTRDYSVDPRNFGASFQSGNIGFGAGQDADRDGRDEITVYAQFGGALGTQMSYVQFIPDPASSQIAGFATGSFGNFGDRLVLGRWTNTGFTAMRVSTGASNLAWTLFGGASVSFGLATDTPLSINVDGDDINDIAIYRRIERRIYAIRSSDGLPTDFPVTAVGVLGIVAIPLGNLQGVTAPPEF
jgi:hypothetical protein